MLSSFRKCSTPLPAVSTRPAMLCESVPLGDAVEGRCTEINEVLHVKKSVVIRPCLLKLAQQIPPPLDKQEGLPPSVPAWLKFEVL
jgi:hypothetical protein